MAQQQQNVHIAAPAFAGVNTEDSPLQTGDSFAEIADNCVIDRYGRLGARRGFNSITDNPGTAFNGAQVETLSIHSDNTVVGTSRDFAWAGSKLWRDYDVPVDVTPAGLVVTSNNWNHGQVGEWSFWANGADEMVYYRDSTNATARHSLVPGVGATLPVGGAVLGAWGRCWTYERVSANQGVLYFSDLLIPYNFNTGTAGSIILDNVWPNGTDDVVALAAHNNFLIIFGHRQILVYGGVNDDPAANATLVDSVVGIGCISRDSVANTGEDVLWLDDTGVRSFNRVIQEKSLPIGDVSANVRSDIRQSIEDSTIAGNEFGFAVYSQATGYYLCFFPDQGYVYCFNISRGPLENGAYRTTRWTNLQELECAVFDQVAGRTLVGGLDRVGHYTGYDDFGSTYRIRYYSNPLDFDDPSRMKIPKQVDLTVIGGLGMTFQLNWSFNFQTNYRKKNFTIDGDNQAQYNISEYNEGAEYTAGAAIETIHINVGGRGRYMTIAVEANVTGPTSLQEFSIQTLIGRII
jgi:hypothetical protein